MTRRFSREWEARLLSLVDQMLEAVAVLARAPEEERGEQFARAIGLAEQASAMAVELLEGRVELLGKLMEQLVAQRLSRLEWPRDAGGLQRELQEVIRRGVERLGEKPSPTEVETGEVIAAKVPEPPTVSEPSRAAKEATAPVRLSSPVDPVRKALAVLFPGREVREGYPFHGTVLGYYLPQERVAVTVEGRYGARKARQEYFCRQEGITLVVLDPDSAGDPYRAAQAIRQAVRRRVG
ncbi:MAG: hypothetical protein ACPLPT_09355 [Moorellales bacterium]